MAVHFKFKSARGDFDSVNIEDGHSISVGNLKEKIIQKLRLGGASDFDLVISNVTTDEEYVDDEFMVQVHTSVLVRRVPRCASSSIDDDVVTTTMETEADDGQTATDEDARIRKFVNSSALDWMRQTQDGPKNPGRLWNTVGTQRPPEGYVCHRCGISGHFIQHCPTNGVPAYDLKKLPFKTPTGISKTTHHDGLYAMPNGDITNEDPFAKEIAGVPSGPTTLEKIPSELRCPICHNALKDAVLMTKCCFTSFCDTCIRNVLLSKPTCVCGTAAQADDLVPNKTLREAVELFTLGPATTEDIVVAAMDEDSRPVEDDVNEEAAANKSPRPKSPDDKAFSDQLDVEEELDYEGFDAEDLNLEEMEALLDSEKEKSPEPVSPVNEKAVDEPDEPNEPTGNEKEDDTEKSQGKEVEVVEPEPSNSEPENADTRNMWKKPAGPNRNAPYQVQYTGYWQASQMMGVNCRLPYGYNAFFPRPCNIPFASGVHPPFHSFNMRRPIGDYQAFRRKREWKNSVDHRRRSGTSPRGNRSPERIHRPRSNSPARRTASPPKYKPEEQGRRPANPRYRRSITPDRHPMTLRDDLAPRTRMRSRSSSPVQRIPGPNSHSRSRSLKRAPMKPSPRGVLENVEKQRMRQNQRRYETRGRITGCPPEALVRRRPEEWRNGGGGTRPPFHGTVDEDLDFSRRPTESLNRSMLERENSNRGMLEERRPYSGYIPNRRMDDDVHPLRGRRPNTLMQPDSLRRPGNGRRHIDDISLGVHDPDDSLALRRPDPDPRQPMRQRGNISRQPNRVNGRPQVQGDFQSSRRPAFRRRPLVDPDMRPMPENDDWGTHEPSYDTDTDTEYPREYVHHVRRMEAALEEEEEEDAMPRPLASGRSLRLRVSMQNNLAPAATFDEAYGEVLNEQDDYDMEEDDYDEPAPRAVRRIVSEILPVKARLQPAMENVGRKKRTAVYFPEEHELLRPAKRVRGNPGTAAGNPGTGALGKKWKPYENNIPEARSVFDRISFGGPVDVEAGAKKWRGRQCAEQHQHLVGGAAGRMVFFGDISNC